MAPENKPSQESYQTRTFTENVKGIMQTFKETGKIGHITPRSSIHANKIARGIAKSTRREAKANQ